MVSASVICFLWVNERPLVRPESLFTQTISETESWVGVLLKLRVSSMEWLFLAINSLSLIRNSYRSRNHVLKYNA